MGLNCPGLIFSAPGAYTYAHIEDGHQGSANDSLWGWKVWFIVPHHMADLFEKMVGFPGELFMKGLVPKLTEEQMEQLGVHVLLQPPGYMVILLPVSHHLPCSYSILRSVCITKLEGAACSSSA